MPLFEIDDPNELWVLWRLVVEAKFHSNPDDGELWGSPYVHALATRIDQALLNAHESSGDRQFIDGHLRWRRSLPENAILGALKQRLKTAASTAWWRQMTEEKRIEFVRGCVSPFEPGREFLASLVREAEA
ncbi:MAG: hypothetical protein KIT13_02170 [Burkholderiales bacterium]|nr:hypothetical protein [Burkholderiales bacterium]MCW5603211.1 hypothetical protein [Burkholderiales bacterium]